MTSVLEKVVDPNGTGKLAMLPGYSVAGKTGTAQKVDPKTKTYADGQFTSSFIGYIPAKKPEFVIFVVYDTPKPEYFGGVVAAPVFRNIASYALSYVAVPPEKGKLASSQEIVAKGAVPPPLMALPIGTATAQNHDSEKKPVPRQL
jgi:cell division protein FtsI (penicillin-binding protein 3)